MKSVIVHALLAVMGLGWAYYVWTADDSPEEHADQVTVVDCPANQVTAISLSGSDRQASIEVTDAEERSFWISTTRKLSAGDEEQDAFAGGEAVDVYLEQVAPLRAVRALGSDLDEETLDELGLKESSTELTLACAGKEHKFMVGGSAFGSGDRYIQNAGDHSVYLVSQSVVRELESAEFRLMQRDLNAFPMTDVAKLRLSAFDRDRELVQRDRHDPQRAVWVDSTDPDRRNELYGNWLDRLTRLRVQKYLPLEAQPGSDLENVTAAPAAVLTVEYIDGDGALLGKLELVRVDAEEPEYYARTNATRAWVKVLRSIAQQVEDDVRPVVGLEPVQRAPEQEQTDRASEHQLPVPSIEALGDLEPLRPAAPSPAMGRPSPASDE